MSVSMTSQLQQQLLAVGADPQAFADLFEAWKAQWPTNEFEFELFGKDGAYELPKVDGQKYGLRHVHLMPLSQSRELGAWLKRFRFRGRKTSDRHLVYVAAERNRYLLIYILDEPDAHEVARMCTAEDRALMETFAIISEDFIVDGTVP